MLSFRINILNPKATKLLKDLEDMNLISIVKENEEKEWKDLSASNFIEGYGDDEPEYTDGDIKEPNPEYKKWKKGT